MNKLFTKLIILITIMMLNVLFSKDEISRRGSSKNGIIAAAKGIE
jgi:hypothetical protein